MAQVARAQGELAGDPLALKSLSVQFRGMGVPEKEITVTSDVRSERATARPPWPARPCRTATSS